MQRPSHPSTKRLQKTTGGVDSGLVTVSFTPEQRRRTFKDSCAAPSCTQHVGLVPRKGPKKRKRKETGKREHKEQRASKKSCHRCTRQGLGLFSLSLTLSLSLSLSLCCLISSLCCLVSALVSAVQRHIFALLPSAFSLLCSGELSVCLCPVSVLPACPLIWLVWRLLVFFLETGSVRSTTQTSTGQTVHIVCVFPGRFVCPPFESASLLFFVL
jgi:hypothetical protein